MGQGRKKDAQIKSLIRQVAACFEDDRKSPASMATLAYFDLTKASLKNKSSNGLRQAAIRLFIDFWTSYNHNLPLEASQGLKLYKIKGGARSAKASAERNLVQEQILHKDLLPPHDSKTISNTQ